MQCRNCGTEIADKAIVCYRCGSPTTDSVRKAVPIKPGRRPLVPIVLIAVLLAIGLSLGYLSRTAAEPEPLQLAAGLCLAGAAVVLLFRVLRRR